MKIGGCASPGHSRCQTASTSRQLTRARPCTTRTAVAAKVAQISRQRRVGAYLRTTTTTDPDSGKPVFTWQYDQAAIDAEAAADTALITVI
jgi:hypothetical protein